LLPNRPIDAPVIQPLTLEHLFPVGQLQSQRQYDLPLRVHPARHPFFDPPDREDGQFRPARQFRFTHQESLSYVSDIVRLNFNFSFIELNFAFFRCLHGFRSFGIDTERCRKKFIREKL